MKKNNQAVTGKGVNKPQLKTIWNTVKHLEPSGLDDVPGWSNEEQQLLDDLGTDGQKDLCRMYIFRRPLRRKMVTLTGQVNAMLPEHRTKVLGSLLGELDNDDRTEVLTNWESHDVDDAFSLSETSSIGSVEEINTGQ